VRRRTLAAACALVLLALTPPIPSAAAVPVLTIDGKGFGHGVGMAQDGAFWMGKSGATTPQILSQFYPGTKQGKGSGTVRVTVLTPTDGQAVVQFPNGGEIRDALDGGQSPGFPVRVGAGGQVRLRFDGSAYSVEGGAATAASAQSAAPALSQARPMSTRGQPIPIDPSTTSTTSSTTTTTAPPPDEPTTTTSTAPPPRPSTGPSSSRPLWAVPSGGGTTNLPVRTRRYRGVVEATAQRGPFRLVNQVDVETYLRGMGEVRDPSWPVAGLRAQAVAARTYALRAMKANGEICDDQRCQVYLGQQAEYGAMDKAVRDTAGQVLVFGTTLASTVYSANGGAHSASRQEGFGTPDDNSYPYLRPAPYPTQNPLPWKVDVALTDVAARLGYRGQLTGASISKTGPSGRALEVTLEGSAGPKTVLGIAFARAFSLKSTLFSVRTGSADAAPVAPPSGDLLQALPEDAAPAFDPMALPPDPLTPDEFAQVIPPLQDFSTLLPDSDVDVRPAPASSAKWPWVSLAAFCLLAVGAAAAGHYLAKRA
jgi:stage II sporulation protein D